MKHATATVDDEKRRILEQDPLTDGVEEARVHCRACCTWIELGPTPQNQLVNWFDHCEKLHSRSAEDTHNTRAATLESASNSAPLGSKTSFKRSSDTSMAVNHPKHAPVAHAPHLAMGQGLPKPPPRDAASAFLQSDPLVGDYTSTSAFCIACQKWISTGHRLGKWHAHCMRPVHGRTKEEIAQMEGKLTWQDVVSSHSPEVQDGPNHDSAEPPQRNQEDSPTLPPDFKSGVFRASKRVQAQARYLELDYDPLAVMLPGNMVHCTGCQRRYQANYWRAHCRDVHGRTESEETQLILRARAAAQEAETIHQRDEDTRRNSMRRIPVPANFKLRWSGVSNQLVARARQLEFELDPLGEVEQEGSIRCNQCDKKLAFGSWRVHCKETHHRSDDDHAQLVLRARAIARGYPDPASITHSPGGHTTSQDAGASDQEAATAEESELSELSSSPESAPRTASQYPHHQRSYTSLNLRDTAVQQRLIDHDPYIRSVDLEHRKIICNQCDIVVPLTGSRHSASLQFWNRHCMQRHQRTREDVDKIMGPLFSPPNVSETRPMRGTKRGSRTDLGSPISKRRRLVINRLDTDKGGSESGEAADGTETSHMDTQPTDSSSLSPLSSVSDLQLDPQSPTSSHNLADYIGVAASDDSKRQAAFLFFLWTHNALAKIAYQSRQRELAAAAGLDLDDDEAT